MVDTTITNTGGIMSSTTQTSTVRAVVTDQEGAIEVASLSRQALGDNTIRISVAAATINPVDEFVAHGGAIASGWSGPGRVGLGMDIAGIVTEVGAAVNNPTLQVGNRVAALAAGAGNQIGAQADEVVVPADAATAIPDGLDLVDAASLPLNTLTADQALNLLGEPTGALLVTGIGGGVGGYIAPLAVARGWRVVGLGRSEDRAYAESVGAELITELSSRTTQFDAAIDSAAIGAPVLDAVRDAGAIVAVVPGLESTPSVTVQMVMVAADGTRLGELLESAARGELPVRVRATYPIDEAEKAYTAFRDGGRGRVVLVTGGSR